MNSMGMKEQRGAEKSGYKFRGMMKKHIFNSGFIAALLIMLACHFACSLYEWKNAVIEPVMEYRPNALMLSVEGIFFGGVMLVLPLCACLPLAGMRRKFSKEGSSCLNGKKDVWREIACGFFSGALCTLIPFIVHSILWNIVSLPAEPQRFESHIIYFDGLYADWYKSYYAIPMYISIAIGLAFSGGVLAVVYMAVVEKIKNPTAAIVFPSCLYFLWLKAGNASGIEGFPTPDALFNDALQVNELFYTLAAYLILLAVSCLLYQRAITRREAA